MRVLLLGIFLLNVLSHEGITVRHIFIECPQYTLARRNNLVGFSIIDILGEDAPIGRIVKFLKEINLFYDI